MGLTDRALVTDLRRLLRMLCLDLLAFWSYLLELPWDYIIFQGLLCLRIVVYAQILAVMLYTSTVLSL